MTTKEHLSKHDREIAAIRKLILEGMRMFNHNQKQIDQLVADQRQTRKALQELAASQKAFLDGLRRGNGNGRTIPG